MENNIKTNFNNDRHLNVINTESVKFDKEDFDKENVFYLFDFSKGNEDHIQYGPGFSKLLEANGAKVVHYCKKSLVFVLFSKSAFNRDNLESDLEKFKNRQKYVVKDSDNNLTQPQKEEEGYISIKSKNIELSDRDIRKIKNGEASITCPELDLTILMNLAIKDAMFKICDTCIYDPVLTYKELIEKKDADELMSLISFLKIAAYYNKNNSMEIFLTSDLVSYRKFHKQSKESQEIDEVDEETGKENKNENKVDTLYKTASGLIVQNTPVVDFSGLNKEEAMEKLQDKNEYEEKMKAVNITTIQKALDINHKKVLSENYYVRKSLPNFHATKDYFNINPKPLDYTDDKMSLFYILIKEMNDKGFLKFELKKIDENDVVLEKFTSKNSNIETKNKEIEDNDILKDILNNKTVYLCSPNRNVTDYLIGAQINIKNSKAKENPIYKKLISSIRTICETYNVNIEIIDKEIRTIHDLSQFNKKDFFIRIIKEEDEGQYAPDDYIINKECWYLTHITVENYTYNAIIKTLNDKIMKDKLRAALINCIFKMDFAKMKPSLYQLCDATYISKLRISNDDKNKVIYDSFNNTESGISGCEENEAISIYAYTTIKNSEIIEYGILKNDGKHLYVNGATINSKIFDNWDFKYAVLFEDKMFVIEDSTYYFVPGEALMDFIESAKHSTAKSIEAFNEKKRQGKTEKGETRKKVTPGTRDKSIRIAFEDLYGIRLTKINKDFYISSGLALGRENNSTKGSINNKIRYNKISIFFKDGNMWAQKLRISEDDAKTFFNFIVYELVQSFSYANKQRFASTPIGVRYAKESFDIIREETLENNN